MLLPCPGGVLSSCFSSLPQCSEVQRHGDRLTGPELTLDPSVCVCVSLAELISILLSTHTFYFRQLVPVIERLNRLSCSVDQKQAETCPTVGWIFRYLCISAPLNSRFLFAFSVS